MSRDLLSLQIGQMWRHERSGGLETQFDNLCQTLPSVKVDVVAMVAGRSDIAAAYPIGGFAPPNAPLPRRLWAARRMARTLIAKHSPSLVASHFALYTYPILDRLRDRPLVVHFQGPWALESAAENQRSILVNAKAAIERAVYRRASRFIVLSNAFGEILRRNYGVDDDRIRVVRGGVDLLRFDHLDDRRTARDRLGWPRDRPIVLAVRRLVRRVGIDALIDAVALARHSVPDLLVLVAGKGPEAARLNQRIEELGVSKWVRLVGFLPDDLLPAAYKAADLTVVPTRSLEGFGLITIESLAAGTPVLVTPVGGLPEVVAGLPGDLVMDSAEPDAIAAGIVDALTGKRAMPSADQCREFVRERYAWNIVASQTRQVYLEAISSDRMGP